MKTAEIRQKFLSFFEERGHTVVDSSPLVPANDPTLLFTNAGMVQFKDVFTGLDSRPYTRATTSQRCLRAGGKHNDLENVGYTARHHTFFEMLGNFSFGDYFKKEAIEFSWTLLTQVFKLPAEKLWATVYEEDDEAYSIWLNDIKLPADRIVRIGDNKGSRYASDNFWQMADTGPCGPCSEVFYDHGPEIWGGPPGSPEEDGDRYIEIWNMVFMQFDRQENGDMLPLPKPCVDTGMGLERLAAVLQHVNSNYEIDLFQNLIRAAARETGATDLKSSSLKVIADHIRACSFLIVDGVLPGNEGSGYVLRRIIRRALRHGHRLGQNKPFFHKLVPDLITEMGQAYPQLAESKDDIQRVLLQEEERFQTTLEKGMQILEEELKGLKSGDKLSGKTAFTLYDTFGFPYDLTVDILREKNIGVDEAGFNAAMQEQRDKARASGKFKAGKKLDYQGEDTAFLGYEQNEATGNVVALYHDDQPVEQLSEGQEGVVVLDNTPFYAESGGQVGDTGTLKGRGIAFEVEDTQKVRAGVNGHHGRMTLGTLKIGDPLKAQIDIERRHASMRNHSATHLMHKALRQVLGSHVQQKGSLVDPDKTRFDFSHDSAVSDQQIQQIESIVNAEVLKNEAVRVRLMAYDDAIQTGAMALFGEKYGDEVRVVDIGFSTELCGGTHVGHTGDIGLFKIVSESGVAAGIRRVEAITGFKALQWLNQLNETVKQTAQILKTSRGDLVGRAQLVQEQLRDLEKDNERLKAKMASAESANLAQEVQTVEGIQVLVKKLPDADPKALRGMIDQLKDQLKSAVIVLATVAGDKVSVAAGVTKDHTDQIKAGQLVSAVCAQIGGKGGGRPDMAMGGGSDIAALDAALASVPDLVEQTVSTAQ